MNQTLSSRGVSRYQVPSGGEWWKQLREKIEANAKSSEEQINSPSPPMNYYNAFHEVRVDFLCYMRNSFILGDQG